MKLNVLRLAVVSCALSIPAIASADLTNPNYAEGRERYNRGDYEGACRSMVVYRQQDRVFLAQSQNASVGRQIDELIGYCDRLHAQNVGSTAVCGGDPNCTGGGGAVGGSGPPGK